MTVLLDDPLARLSALPEADAEELMCRAHLGVWTGRRQGLEMSPLHWEWCELRMTARRLAVVAPREHAKTETFTVNGTAWQSIYTPGLWTYVFAQTKDQAAELLLRIIAAVNVAAPWMVSGMKWQNKQGCQFANYARVSVAGSGTAIRGGHPDVIVGDDVLGEDAATSARSRKVTKTWWLGAVGGMAHPGTTRSIGRGEQTRLVRLPATRIFLVGTPFHQSDLLMGMRENPVYQFRRYAAEFREEDLVDGLAVEVA